MPYQIIVHGGAYSHEGDGDAESRRAFCRTVVAEVAQDLQKGAAALDACEQAIKLLEDHPLFDAGTGSFIQADGEVRMDAALMTSDLDLGCVIQISGVKNPISIARRILENPLHCTLSGAGAKRFAEECGFADHDPKTAHTLALHERLVSALGSDRSYGNIAARFGPHAQSLGTVGCVVRDGRGTIAAGTSTGGREVCYQGRVGDSGQPGNGTYANEYAGVSCTGVGEKIMRIGVARVIALYVELGDTLDLACAKAIAKLGAIDGRGGVIAVSGRGEIAYRYNTRAMDFAMARG